MEVLKETIADYGVTELQLPQGAKVLTAQVQHEQVRIWFIGQIGLPKEKRTFLCYPTGVALSPNLKYIATFQLEGGDYIGHVFEE